MRKVTQHHGIVRQPVHGGIIITYKILAYKINATSLAVLKKKKDEDKAEWLNIAIDSTGDTLETILPHQHSIVGALAFSSAYTFAVNFISPFVGAFLVTPIINAYKWLISKIKHVPFKPQKIFEKIKPIIPAISCTISGIILGAIQGGLFGVAFGPAGIIAGIFIGAITGGVSGFLGGYFSTKLFGLLVDLIHWYKGRNVL